LYERRRSGARRHQPVAFDRQIRLVIGIGVGLSWFSDVAAAQVAPWLPATGAAHGGFTEDCDRLAGSRYDRQRPSVLPGVSSKDIDAALALPACEKALAADPDNPRLAYELGLVRATQGKGTEAVRLYRMAADRGYAAAQAELGFFYMVGRGGLPHDDWEASRLYKLAVDQGNALAQARLGLFSLARFIHRGFETAVPQRVGGAVLGGVGDAAVGV
jgi:TPR repeat protein